MIRASTHSNGAWQSCPLIRVALLHAACAVLLLFTAEAAAFETPSELYGELFVRVQLEQVFSDSKTFVDAVPVRSPAQVLAAYRRESQRPDFDLRRFVAEQFVVSPRVDSAYRTVPGQRVQEHIDRLWSVLAREPDEPPAYASRLPLPHRYVVPGGRFSEIYYWDSYFTMLGLEESGRHDLTVAMVRNFAWLIDRYGYIPNGSRSYYLSRSQPPFFAMMVELVAERDGKSVYVEYLSQLKREYAFWMDGSESLTPGSAHRRVVRLRDGSLLNRHWDDRDTPRDEAYREDVETARLSTRPAHEVYRDLRAAAESGWDFSSRWLSDGQTLATIRTTELVPPDLNSLLYRLELTIAEGCRLQADAVCTKSMRARANARRASIQRHLWNPRVGVFVDYDWRAQSKGTRVTAAALYPLYLKVSTKAQARSVAAVVRSKLLDAHGLATTTVQTGQQWDAPNGWAPLQWIAIRGLRSYGEGRLAATIARRWVGANLRLYRATGKLVEKYDVTSSLGGTGGEYPLQDGFGWTNGVLRRLLALYPRLSP